MYYNKQNKKSVSQKRGFTLIELLTVIAIIGLLSSVSLVTIQTVRERGRQAAASQKVSQISQSYYSLALASSTKRSSRATNTNDWAVDIVGWANGEGPNDASLWFVDGAVDINGNDIPTSLAVLNERNRSGGSGGVETKGLKDISLDGSSRETTRSSNSKWIAAPEWNNASPDYNAVANYLKGANAATTPLMWTKGIDNNGGEWFADSPYEGDGGHVAFADGRVVWMDSTVDKFVHYDTKKPTASFEEAIKSSRAKYRNAPTIIQPKL